LGRRLWLRSPDHLRVELLNEQENVIRLGVRDETHWWRWDLEHGITTGSALPNDPGVATLPPMLSAPLLDVRRLIAMMRFEPDGSGQRAGREVLRARAQPRRQPSSRGALSYEFEFDAEHGSLLRRAEFEDGHCVWEREAREVLYGSPLNPECFVFVAPGDPEGQDVEAAVTRPQPRGSESGGVVVGSGRLASRSAPGLGGTVWLTGIPAAGKTTLAAAVHRALSRNGLAACILDGGVLRRGLSSDLGLSPSDRTEQARRAGHVAALVSRARIVAIVALVSPYAEDRRHAREAHAELGLPFLEVWVDTPRTVCEQRDPKGLYAAVRAGELHGLTGLDSPYEVPDAADLRVPGYGNDPDAMALRIVDLLTERVELADTTTASAS
jgi:adenylyl-sulfate kinase